MKDVIASSCVGIGQLTIGHPFDTAKILIQNKQKWFPHPIKRYYRGWKFPLFYSSLFNITCFTTHERSYKYTKNHFLSGALGGFAISPITYILESFKIKFQVDNPAVASINNKQLISHTFKQLKTRRGLYSAMSRETLAMGIYFHTFHKLKNYITTKTSYNERKKLGIKITFDMVASVNYLNEWEEHFNKHKKKDDLADSFLQGLWYIKEHHNIS